MSADPNKKSVRSFQCRDVLWETFEQMARELECSVDYLINEAMKQYARQRSYGPGAVRTPFPSQAPRDAYPQPPEPRAATFTGPLNTAPSMPLPQPPRQAFYRSDPQRSQRLASARDGRVSERRLLHGRHGLDERRRIQRPTHRPKADCRRGHLPHLRSRSPLHLSLMSRETRPMR